MDVCETEKLAMQPESNKRVTEELIERASRGDKVAFEELYREYSGFVFAVALRMTRHRQDAEEVTQEVFVRIYRFLKTFKAQSSFKTWVYRITANTAMNALKQSSRRKDETGKDEILENAVAPETQKAKLDQEDAQKRLQEFLGHLNPDQRICVILRELQGLSYEEIAGSLNVNINTVRTRLKRAREKLLEQARSKGGTIYELP